MGVIPYESMVVILIFIKHKDDMHAPAALKKL